MKKFIIIVSVIFCGCLFAKGQAPAPTPFPEEWQTFSPEKEEFSIATPIKLEKEKYDDDARRYIGKLNDTYFFILAEKITEMDLTGVGLRFIRGFQAKGETIAFGDLKAEKFGFTDDEGFYQRAVYLKTNTRVYLFHTVSDSETDNSARRFFRNLAINSIALSGAGTDFDPVAPKVVSEGRASIPPVGMGIGDGTGSGSGPAPIKPNGGGASVSETPDPSRPTVGVKILTKERPPYTDIARIYGVQGAVTLRITFLADGTIGSIKPSSRLPLGLTKSAIAAARAVTFAPAQRLGVPYSKTMTIQYGFSIY